MRKYLLWRRLYQIWEERSTLYFINKTHEPISINLFRDFWTHFGRFSDSLVSYFLKHVSSFVYKNSEKKDLKNSSVNEGDSPLRYRAANTCRKSSDSSANSALKGRDCARAARSNLIENLYWDRFISKWTQKISSTKHITNGLTVILTAHGSKELKVLNWDFSNSMETTWLKKSTY